MSISLRMMNFLLITHTICPIGYTARLQLTWVFWAIQSVEKYYLFVCIYKPLQEKRKSFNNHTSYTHTIEFEHLIPT